MTVYFITEKGRTDGPVKIGVTADLTKRLNGLQTGHHRELQVIATLEGGRETEAYLHEMLARWRIRGEWYSRTAEVEEAIERAKLTGRASLPLSDPGLATRVFTPNQDVAQAKRLCREITDRVMPDRAVPERTAWLARKLQKSCPAMTERRIKTLYFGEAKRVDYSEMMALIDLRDRLHQHCTDRSLTVTAPIIVRLMSELGTPLSPQSEEIIDRHIRLCADRLQADRAEWGFNADLGDAR